MIILLLIVKLHMLLIKLIALNRYRLDKLTKVLNYYLISSRTNIDKDNEQKKKKLLY